MGVTLSAQDHKCHLSEVPPPLKEPRWPSAALMSSTSGAASSEFSSPEPDILQWQPLNLARYRDERTEGGRREKEVQGRNEQKQGRNNKQQLPS